MSELKCPKTELPVGMCAHCRGDDELYTTEPLRWFEAEFHGRCCGCGTRIVPGDEIAWNGDGYVCREGDPHA